MKRVAHDGSLEPAIGDSGIRGPRLFPSTYSSVIENAVGGTSPESRANLERLVQLYWKPVYGVIRKAWRRSADDAKDLTQEFFATVILEGALTESFNHERGSFRTYLRAALTNFMRNDARDTLRQKRGGHLELVSSEEIDLEDVTDDAQSTPEQAFDRLWNAMILSRALAALEGRLEAEGKGVAFRAFERYELQEGDAQPSYAQVGAALGLSEPQVRHALRHARQTFRQIATEMVADYVDGPDALAQELERLFLPAP